MARWEPDPRGRLLRAALDLFAEQGYEATTSAQLAERAGLAKATVFRLFADKREILFQGQGASVRTIEATVSALPSATGALDAVTSALRALCENHVPEQKEIGRRIETIVATSVELQERTAYKRYALSRALEEALVARGEDRGLAGVLADVGTRAYYDGFATWTRTTAGTDLADLVLDRLDALLDGLRPVVTEQRRSGNRAER